MFYGNIKNCDTADGIGVRVSLFVSGCNNRCKGCFQPETWDFNYGKEFTKKTEDQIIEMLKPCYINGLTLLGGDPMEICNQHDLINLVKRVKSELPKKTIWCYTGYVYDRDLVSGGKRHTTVTDELIGCIDTLVDGPFIEEQKDIRLRFRGSLNQRIINVPATLREGKVILSELN